MQTQEKDSCITLENLKVGQVALVQPDMPEECPELWVRMVDPNNKTVLVNLSTDQIYGDGGPNDDLPCRIVTAKVVYDL